MTEYKIYTLTCPLDGSVKYIGRTKQPLETRLNAHINESKKSKSFKSIWLNELIKRNKLPTIKYIFKTDCEKTSKIKEIYFIIKYKKKHNLLNTVYNIINSPAFLIENKNMVNKLTTKTK
jgi:hypothetical protein